MHGLGVPHVRTGRRGDLICVVRVVVPSHLSAPRPLAVRAARWPRRQARRGQEGLLQLAARRVPGLTRAYRSAMFIASPLRVQKACRGTRDDSRISLQENAAMAVVRWSPWSDLFDLHTQMDHAFQSPATASRNGVDYTSLPVDIQQTEGAFIVEASVPGFNPGEVEVTFEDGVLTIAGKRTTSETAKNATYLRRERRATSVFRQVGLPAEFAPTTSPLVRERCAAHHRPARAEGAAQANPGDRFRSREDRADRRTRARRDRLVQAPLSGLVAPNRAARSSAVRRADACAGGRRSGHPVHRC